jgi:hypothetical protein
MKPEYLLRKRDLAKMLACSLRAVDRLANGGRLTRVRILGGIRFRLNHLGDVLTAEQYSAAVRYEADEAQRY